MEIGAPRQRRVRSVAPRQFDITIDLDLNQFQTFEYWYQNDVKGGAAKFDIQLLDDDNDLVWYTVQIVGVYQYANVGPLLDQWTVTMTIRTIGESFAVRAPGTDDLRAITVFELTAIGSLHVPYVMRGLASLDLTAKASIGYGKMYGQAYLELTAVGELFVNVLYGKATFDMTATGNLQKSNLMRGLANIEITPTVRLNTLHSYPLDTYASSLVYAYARQRLLGSYGGALYRVRRDSDNAEHDVTADSYGDDLADLMSFVGSDSAYLVKWYDQSGNSHDLLQATSTKQAQAVDRGIALHNFQPDSIDDRMQTAGSLPAFANYVSTYYAGQIHPTKTSSNTIPYISGNTKSRFWACNSGGGSEFIVIGSGTANVTMNAVRDCGNSWTTNLTDVTVGYQNAIRNAQTLATISVSGTAYDHNDIDSTPFTIWSDPADTSDYASSKSRAMVGYNDLHTATVQDIISKSLQTRPTADTAPFAQFIVGLVTSVSLVQLLNSYSGSALRVRRDSDDAEQDIGFVSGALDTTSLATFVGSANGLVTKWYDQSGHGQDLVQTTKSKQPKLVNAGTYLALVRFDGVDDVMTFTTPKTNSVSFASSFTLRNLSAAGTFPCMFGVVNPSSNSAENAYGVVYQSSSSIGISQCVSPTSHYFNFQWLVDTNPHFGLFNYCCYPYHVHNVYMDGTFVQTSSGGPGFLGTVFPSYTFAVGGQNGIGDGYAAIDIRDFAMWGNLREGDAIALAAIM
jgi:alpha-L-arabinofuranosidase B-like protein